MLLQCNDVECLACFAIVLVIHGYQDFADISDPEVEFAGVTYPVQITLRYAYYTLWTSTILTIGLSAGVAGMLLLSVYNYCSSISKN